MSKTKMDTWMRENGFTLGAEGKMVPMVSSPDGWRELAFAPMPKGMLALVPRLPKMGIQAADVPDCSISLPSVKAELLRFMDEADIRTPEAAAKWRAVFMAAHLDECLLEGITDQLARRCTIRAILHLLCHFSMFVKASEGKMSPEEVRKLVVEARAENIELHEKTRVAAVDAAWGKLKQGGQKQEAEGRIQEAMDKMAVLIREKVMSPEDAADKVWGDYRDKGKPLGIKAHTLANRYRKERGPKPRPRNPKNLP